MRDAAAWAASIGFAPHRDFLAVERLFGDVNCDASDATFLFGREGKPLYVPGPKESPAQIRHRIEQLRGPAHVPPTRALQFLRRTIEPFPGSTRLT